MQFNVRLKQYTSIIQFQYERGDPPGPTLRATELKPKLDAVLREKEGVDDERIRYQLRIRPLGKLLNADDRFHPKDFPRGLYFGNQGKNVRNKFALLYQDGAELSVNTYFDNDLAEKIKSALPKCLAIENFGTRQNKGFGCFYIHPDHSKGYLSIENALKETGKPVYFFNVENHSIQKESLDHISVLYKAMKSGINETGFGKKDPKAYLKSFLWHYLNRKQSSGSYITWEKRFIKKGLLGQPVKDAQYFRALLGLCDTYSFKEIPQLNIRSARMDADYGDSGRLNFRGEHVISVSHPDIARFKSPITFKPVGRKVYVVLHPDAYKHNETCLQGATFHFEGSGVKGDLKVPDKNDFNLVAFMDYVVDRVNNRKYGTFRGMSARILNGIKLEKLK